MPNFTTPENLFNWKSYFSRNQYEVLSGPLLWYSKYISRAIFYTSLLYPILFTTTRSIVCTSNSQVSNNFVEKMCLLPYYGAHSIHRSQFSDGNYEPHQSYHKDVYKYDYYIAVFAILLVQSFVSYFPLALFTFNQSRMIHQLETVIRIIDFFPYDSNNRKVSKHEKHCFHKLFDLSKPEIDKPQIELQFRKILALQKVFLAYHCSRTFVVHHCLTVGFALLTIVAQIYALNWIFHDMFNEYNLELVRYFSGMTKIFPENLIFPYFVTCHFKMTGQSGSVSLIDSYCVMQLNLINRYVFTAIWFVLILMFVAILLNTAFKFLLIVSKCFRASVRSRSKQISSVFSMIPDESNIYHLFDADNKDLEKMFYWTFVMIEFTSIDVELLVKKIEDMQMVLVNANSIDLFNAKK